MYASNYYKVTSSVATKYYYFGAQRVAMQTIAGVTYLHGDNLRSTSVASTANGALASRQTYYAFGAMRTNDVAPITLITEYNYTGQPFNSYINLIQTGGRTLQRFGDIPLQVKYGISAATKNKNRRALATVQILDNTRNVYRNGK